LKINGGGKRFKKILLKFYLVSKSLDLVRKCKKKWILMRYDILDCTGYFFSYFADVEKFLGCPVYKGDYQNFGKIL